MRPITIDTRDSEIKLSVSAFLQRHHHHPMLVSFDGGKPFLVILLRDNQHQMWQAGLHENFRTHQVVEIELSKPYPTLHIAVESVEVE